MASTKPNKKIVFKITDDIDPSEVYCTTYQMRNFFAQFADGFFSSLDIMNYIQHHKCVTMMKKDDKILDVCCGRGLLLPLIRYYKKDIHSYTGVDIHESNINEQKRRSGIKKIDDINSYYPFQINHLISSCEDMDKYLEYNSFDVIVYTSAIEHMQKEVGYRSLQNCFNLLKKDGLLILSCPNTQDKKDPYDTQYAAHLYEWDLDELSLALKQIGFNIYDTFGLVGKVRDFEKYIDSIKSKSPEIYSLYNRFKEYLPTPWLMSFFPILYPEAAAEVMIMTGKTDNLKLSKNKNNRKLTPFL